ncbi:MAG: 3-oxoacyl-ACP synthase III [Planctomycetes bacterium]|nr:3-oxoacyl-ACP synthase III [Planctomycetota bacterium]
MRFQHVCLEALAYVLPEQVVTSLQLEQRLAAVYERFSLREGRLELMTGIRERRFWDVGTLPSDGSVCAGRLAMERCNARPDDIGCLIHAAVSRDCLEPATASTVHEQLGLAPATTIFDLSNACLGFLNAMICLANMIELGQVSKGLIVASESSRPLVETTIATLLNDPTLTRQQLKGAFASLTIGSGAVALVMSHDSVSSTNHRLVGGAVRTATEHNHLCRGSADTGFSGDAAMVMNTDAETLLVSGCQLAAETWDVFKETLDWSNDEVDRCFTHQVGLAHRDLLYESLKLDPAADFSTVELLGNVGSVSLPLTMAMGIEKAPPGPGAKIAMLGIGSGLNCTMLGVRW